MSLDTTVAQGAARDAEAAWARHRKTCSRCGDKRRPVRKCRPGLDLYDTAQKLRESARESARADKAPGPGDVPLFGPEDFGGPWHVTLSCRHEYTSERPVMPGRFVSCLTCQSQRKITGVTAGQGSAG